MSGLRTIHLGGILGKKFGRRHELAVTCAAEASHALCQMLPGFEAFLMSAKDKGLAFAVYVSGRNIAEKELVDSIDGDIRFTPIVMGAKNSGGIMAILGAVLVVVGIFLIWTPFGAPLIGAGISLLISGIAMMLVPSPQDEKSEDEKDAKANYAFNGPINTQAQGNPVPILYGGPIHIGSAVISASIDATEEAHAPVTPARGGTSQGGGGSAFHQIVTQLEVP